MNRWQTRSFGWIEKYANGAAFTLLKNFTLSTGVGSVDLASACMDVYTNLAELNKGNVDFKGVFNFALNRSKI